jgi:hypothetical protein
LYPNNVVIAGTMMLVVVVGEFSLAYTYLTTAAEVRVGVSVSIWVDLG